MVSSKIILNRLYNKLGSTTEISETLVVEHIADALLLIGSHYQFEETNSVIEIVDGKVQLPNNFYKLISVMYNGLPLAWNTSNQIPDFGCNNCSIPVCCTYHTFYINNSYLVTNITQQDIEQQPNICISYLGMPIDEEGYPMIPDDIYFLKACEAYVIHMLDYRDWRKGLISDKVFNKSESEHLFYINAAKGAANLPNLNRLERLKNIMIRLIPSQNAFANNFKNIGNTENLKRH